MAIYNIPVTWTGTQSNKTGVINLTIGQGNIVNAKWGSVGGSIKLYDTTSITSWSYLEVDTSFKQGDNTTSIKYEKEGKFYPGNVYAWAVDFNTIYQSVSEHVINLSCFANHTLLPPNTIPLDVTSLIVEKPFNLSCTTKKIYDDIIINFEMISNNRVTYDVVQDGTILVNSTTLTGRTIRIPKGTIRDTRNITVRLYSSTEFLGQTHNSETVNYVISGLEGVTSQTPQNIIALNKEIYNNITLSCDNVANHTYKWQVYVNNTLKLESAYVGNTYIIPYGTIKSTTDNVRVTVTSKVSINGYDSFSSGNSVISGFVGLSATRPTNIFISSKEIFKDITVTCDKVAGHTYRFILYIDNTQKLTTAFGEPTFNIPLGTITNVNSSIRVLIDSKYVVNGYEAYNNAETSISGLVGFEAETPRNLMIVGAGRNIEEDMLFKWETTDTTTNKTTFEVWQDGNHLLSQTGLTAKQFVLKGGTLSNTNAITIKIYNVANLNGFIATSNIVTLSVSDLTTIKPIIEDFYIDSFNRDYPINIVPSTTGATEYAYMYNGVRVNGLVIASNTLGIGLQQITLIAIVTTLQGNKIESTLTKTFSIERDEPTIYSLEPNGLDMNVERDIVVSFVTSNFVDRWRLSYAGVTIEGTTARQHIVPKNVFKKGTQTITLTTYYKDRQHTKTATFYAYGLPVEPTLINQQDVYRTSRPKFEWLNRTELTDKQTGFEYRIVKSGTIVETKEVLNTNLTFTVEQSLLNNSTYEIWLRVKNKWNIYSNWTKHTFETSFTELPSPVLELYENGDNILITFSCPTQPLNFEQILIYRSENNGEWIKIGDKYNYTDSLIDYCITPNVLTKYKVRLYDKDGSFSESETKSGTCKVQSFSFADVENPSTVNKTLHFVKPVYNIVRDVAIHSFSNKKPIVFKGNKSYYSGQLTCTIEREEILDIMRLFDESTVLCYKTYRGEKLHVVANIESITPLNHAFDSIVISITEVNFNEELMYSGTGQRKLTYFNGEYKFNDTITFSGEHLTYE